MDRGLNGGRAERVVLEAAGVAPGVYVVRVAGERFTQSFRVVLSR